MQKRGEGRVQRKPLCRPCMVLHRTKNGIATEKVADVPKETEFEGLRNLVNAVSKYSSVNGKTLFGCQPSFQDGWRKWGALDDVVRKVMERSREEVKRPSQNLVDRSW